MQKLVIKRQFMGVKPCEIELNRFLLLIGEQASGKSTIAKLIFFFETLPTVIYSNIVKIYPDIHPDSIENAAVWITEGRFIQTFGIGMLSEGEQTQSLIHYYYNTQEKGQTYQIEIYRDNNIINPTFHISFDADLTTSISIIVKEYINFRRIDENIDEGKARKQLREKLNKLFYSESNEYTYLIAGRNNIVAFPEIFETVVGKELEKLIEDEIKGQEFEKRQRLGNERLLYEFVEWSKGIRTYFKNNGQTFEGVAKTLLNQNALTIIQKIANNILKGSYTNSQWGEQIKLENNNVSIPLKDASSGQQEVLRLLQGLFLSIGLQNRKEFFVVEEPEAHLYPLAQKELINAFAVFLNTIPQGKIVVTTHSPYILACINILLFANYVSNEIGQHNLNGSISNIPRPFWLNSSIFNAYSLGQNDNYCVDIKDPVTGLIDQNYLDAISEQLGLQQQELYNLLTEKML